MLMYMMVYNVGSASSDKVPHQAVLPSRCLFGIVCIDTLQMFLTVYDYYEPSWTLNF